MKKKLFIFSQWMEIDGVEASLLGLLKELDYTQVEVDLFLTLHRGPWMSEIPKEVNLLPANQWIDRYASGFETLKQKKRYFSWVWLQLIRYATGFYYRFVRHQHVDYIGFEQLKYAFWAPFLPRWLSEKQYDLALIFGGAPGFSRRVKAKTSAVWIHDDWKHYRPIPWLARLQFKAMSRVVNVGKVAKQAFDQIARLSTTTESLVVENVLSPTWVRDRAQRYSVSSYLGLKLLSVGRVSPQKNPPRALQTAIELKRRGIDFKWYFVGGGECLDGLRRLHAESGLGDSFVITGATDNPYPYYPWCDFYICTSDWEAKSVSVREAQMFQKPTIITRYPTSASQLEDGIDGLIVERDPIALADAIEALAKDPERQKELSAACATRDYANLSEISKILSWCE